MQVQFVFRPTKQTENFILRNKTRKDFDEETTYFFGKTNKSFIKKGRTITLENNYKK